MPDINTPNYPVTESPKLSPNPKLTTSYEDGGRGTPTIVVTEAKEQVDTTGVSLPEYTGDYEITENGTLETAGKALKEDIVVAIPEYEGSYSVTENGTLATKGKVMTGDVTVNVPSNGIFEVSFAEYKRLHPTNWSYAFDSCFVSDRAQGYIDIDSIDFNGSENVTNMSGMFWSCGSLVSVPLFNTSKVRDMSYMFNSCRSLTSVPLFDTSSVTNMSQMFIGCVSLTAVPAFDVSKVTNLSSIFSACSDLEAIHMFGMKVKFDISASTKFTREALLEIINNCADLTGQTAQKITMGSTNLAKLTEEDKLIATNKNWTLA